MLYNQKNIILFSKLISRFIKENELNLEIEHLISLFDKNQVITKKLPFLNVSKKSNTLNS